MTADEPVVRLSCCLENRYKVSSRNSHAGMFRADISVYRDSSNVENSM